MKKFITLNKYGELYIDKILFETYFPIIFTYKNENNDIFICVCCQCNENGCKWLVGRTNGSCIVRMLQKEITIEASGIMVFGFHHYARSLPQKVNLTVKEQIYRNRQ